ncbi:ComE operon protein 2 [Hyella patelloides LEGE 07179]|uniref:ComE operon protein 2 n=1 Tax=Hyella patelloides LEGE 07179 TaxID=945734 RepID=A0A563VT25_9CYAN|nr:anti-phage dCTP deaminase [Hyella patelloides]VEP14548.1 ComE operon protein 2 [Hyella patelloides LEGE 07179]
MDNKKALEEILSERNKFILIGLTGRTGSGCTTASNILNKEKINFPDPEQIRTNGKAFYEELDVYRYTILKKYAEANWQSFFTIKVSDIISIYLFQLSKTKLIEFIYYNQEKYDNKDKIPKESIKNIVNKIKEKNKIFFNKIKEISDITIFSEKDLSSEQIKHQLFIRLAKLVRKLTRDFKQELKCIDETLYVSIYQAAGNSIRKLGKVDINYKEASFDTSKIFHLPETLNRIIKAIRKIKDRAFIVIDALRNPYEVSFFRDRYAAFKLVAVNAPDQDRKKYLQQVHKFNIDQLDKLDKNESGQWKSLEDRFTVQNVKKCIEMSDIHIFNPRNELKNHNILASQLAWYFSLMHHPGLVSPTSMERSMQIAFSAKTNSGCISRQVGAVITDNENSIKAVGWNDVPSGQVPCSLRSVYGALNHFDERIYSHYERNNSEFRKALEEKYKENIEPKNNSLRGRNLSYCFKEIKNSIKEENNQVHTRALHAEENAFLQLTKYGGIGIQGGKLYTTASPCELCAKKAYQLGIKEIIFIDPYPGIAKEHILQNGKYPPTLTQFHGAVGRGYHQLYESALSYKDELKFLL